MIRLAWRNVWRNFRRSLITTTSMACGLAAIMFGQSLIKSLQHQLIEKATGSVAGHIEIQAARVEDFKFPDRYFDGSGPVDAALRAQPGLKAYSPRIHITGLISSPAASQGVYLSAVEPAKEREVTTMWTYLTQGQFLPGPKTIMMGDKMAQHLDVRLGEKVVVMAQAQDGSMGADAFRVAGIYHSGSASFDGQIAYIPLKAAQDMLVAGNKVNNIAVRLDDLDDSDRVQEALAEKLHREPVQVLTWKTIDHEIPAIIRFEDGLLGIVLVIIFAIVALGILNTLLMSLMERVREFGVLMAIGAKPRWVLKLVLIEAVSLGLVGTAGGLAAGIALIGYFHHAGLRLPIGDAMSYFIPFPSVIYTRWVWREHAFAACAVLATSVLAAVAPALRACRLRPAEALRHV